MAAMAEYNNRINSACPEMIRAEKKIAVSVIMPVYNAGKYLHECLDSLLAQTLENFEVICVDDGSSDDSPAILSEYAEKDQRFTILTQDHGGAGAARNLGMSHAKGKHLIFLDSDDRFLPRMLELSVKKAEETDADICVFPAQGFDNQSGKSFPLPASCCPGPLQQGVFSRADDPKKIFSFTKPAPWNKLFKKDFILKNDLQFQNTRSANDLAFVLTALACADRITTLDQPLLQYRSGNSQSLQGSQTKEPRAFYLALTEFRKRLRQRNLFDSLEQAFINEAAADIFYNLHTLKDAAVFEETYSFIAGTVLEEFGLTGRDPQYFYVLPEWRIPERIRIMREGDILDYAAEFCASLPELQRKALKNMDLNQKLRFYVRELRAKLSR